MPFDEHRRQQRRLPDAEQELTPADQPRRRRAAQPGHPGDERHRRPGNLRHHRQGLCDFISAMDTQRIPEWNCWYHIMNCGFPLKASGETDFPASPAAGSARAASTSSSARSTTIDFADWCEGIAKGRSYVSDGYAHALEFSVNGKP